MIVKKNDEILIDGSGVGYYLQTCLLDIFQYNIINKLHMYQIVVKCLNGWVYISKKERDKLLFDDILKWDRWNEKL